MSRTLKLTMILGGLIAVLGPMLGLIGTVVGMAFSFDSLGASGISTPEELSSHIGVTLISTVAGIMLGIIGIMIVLTGLIIWLCTREKPSPPPFPDAR